jgi:S-adenosylmethionine:tRNA ribosyltransferase-isomerase
MDSLEHYDYDLPEELIATEPPAARDASRLLLVDRRTGRFHHHRITDLPELLDVGDMLALNNTEVIPARLLGLRTATGGKWEGLFLRSNDSGHWYVIGQSRGRLKAGERLTILPAHAPESRAKLVLTLLARDDDGVWTARPDLSAPALELLQLFGTVPLPPYIRRKLATESDWQRYQTTFAREPGAVAAPTAGLHFTPELLATCRKQGIAHDTVTLHVGIGTFRPIAVEALADHRMHSEWCEVRAAVAERLEQARQAGGRIIAVGTTVVRTLESAAPSGRIEPIRRETDLFIRPPYEFRAIDGLLTNFHLPKSSLLVLVSAFAGRELVRAAYDEAIQEEYRFYSYGDAMLIL